MTQKFHNHFSAVANRYAGFRPHYPAALFDYLATLVSRNSTVWDCACGNGQATIDLAGRFERVIGTDASAEQIASATPHANVEYRVATAENSDLADESVGLLTVAQAIHWFDFDRFYAEATRVLIRAGVLAAWAYGVNEVEGETINEVAQDYYANIVGPYWPPERKLVEEGYRTIPFPLAEISPPTIHMETRWDLDQLLGYFSTWSATNRFIKANGYNPLEKLEKELAELWGERQRKRRITWPLSFRIGRITK
jgi:ubiquinone/menaquinone biosynthesis C-methylase UbiE